MAPIFASSDIAALVASFPPPIPTKDCQSLLPALNANHLLNSQRVLSKFCSLIETRNAADTISLRELPALLNVKDTKWLLNSYDGPIRFTDNRQSIITLPHFEYIMESLRRAKNKFVELPSFAKENDISLDSITDQELCRLGLCRIPQTSVLGSSFATSPESVEETKRKIRHSITDSAYDEIDLSENAQDIPLMALRALIGEIEGNITDIQGRFEDRGDRIVYIPDAYAAAQQESQRTTYDSLVQNKVHELDEKGFTHIYHGISLEPSQLQADVISKYKEQHRALDSDACILEINDGSKAIVLRHTLDAALEESQATLKRSVETRGQGRPQVMTEDLDLERMSFEFKQPALTRLLFQSQYRAMLNAAIVSKVDEMKREEQNEFGKLFQETVMAPLYLYAAALVGDATLKQNQDTYLSTFFRQQIIPSFIEAAHQQRWTQPPADDSRLRDIEQLKEFCKASDSGSQGKTFKDVQAAVTRFARRQKIASPDTETISRVREEALRQKSKTIQKMDRGSDILQNLLWIAFARAEDNGLFMSAGKDTGRMIAQYKVVGDLGIWQKLSSWRSKLKDDGVKPDDIHEMKDLVVKLLREMGVLAATETEV